MCVGSIATRASRGGAERLRGQRTVDRVSGDRLAHSTQSVSETTRDERSRRGLRGAHATCGSRGVCTWHGSARSARRTAIRSVFAVRVRCLWGTRPVVSVFESVRPSSTSSAAGDALYAPPPASCVKRKHTLIRSGLGLAGPLSPSGLALRLKRARRAQFRKLHARDPISVTSATASHTAHTPQRRCSGSRLASGSGSGRGRWAQPQAGALTR